MSSLGGERLAQAALLEGGLAHDRSHGLFDARSDEISYPSKGRRWRTVPMAASRWSETAGLEVSADGVTFGPPETQSRALEDMLGFPPAIREYAAAGPQPRYRRAPIHLLTNADMARLRALLPDAVLDLRRFRPNLMVMLDDVSAAMPQDEWLGREIRLGEAVLRATIPCVRCGFTSMEQPGLPMDPRVLQHLVQDFGRNFGIYCEVLVPGQLREGDALALGPAVAEASA
ncbi:MOSC domain-containing protein [Roseomonas sp. 18066]|uniref:MOSC domain-containing protein n=1 Tax=Roseomonas sp. 18066 TaxID=2681412 RepID=UPI00135B39AD|nr:MOSC domain-containing protein [Roseomonas sp. 18066]